MTTTCKSCHAPKPDDRFRACPDCRAAWRAYSKGRARKGDTTMQTIRISRDVLDALRPEAKARGMTAAALARALLATIAEDGMVAAMVDDGGEARDAG